jgi:hypothetical protein
MISFLGIHSRFGTAVSEDEASDLAMVDAPVKKTTKNKSPKPHEPIEEPIEDEEVETEDVEAEDEDDEAEDDDEAGEGE